MDCHGRRGRPRNDKTVGGAFCAPQPGAERPAHLVSRWQKSCWIPRPTWANLSDHESVALPGARLNLDPHQLPSAP